MCKDRTWQRCAGNMLCVFSMKLRLNVYESDAYLAKYFLGLWKAWISDAHKLKVNFSGVSQSTQFQSDTLDGMLFI